MNAYQGQIAPASLNARDVFGLLWRRAWVILLILGLTAGATYYITIHTTKAWTATAQMVMSARPASGIMQTGAQDDSSSSIDTQVTMLQSPAMIDRTITLLKNDALRRGDSPDTVHIDAHKLTNALNVVNPKMTNLIQVSVEWEDTKKAIELSNAVCRAFVDWKLEIMRSSYDAALQSLRIRASRAEDQLRAAERRETAFKLNNHYIDVNEEQEEALRQYQSYLASTLSLGAEVQAEQAHNQELKKRLDEANKLIGQAPYIRDDAQIAGLQARLTDLQTQRDTAALTYKRAFPGVLSKFDTQIEQAKKNLADALHSVTDKKRPSLPMQSTLQNEYANSCVALIVLQAKQAAATKIRNQHQAALLNVPQKRLQYERLVRDKLNAEGLYKSLWNGLGQVEVSRNAAIPDVVISQNAYAPPDPSRPNLLRNSLFGGVIGLLLTFMAVLMLEQSDQRMRSMGQMRSLMPGPIIGALPSLSRRQLRALTQGNAIDYTSEAYSLTRANLSLALRSVFNGTTDRGQVIMVTSAVPGEGKSLTAASLARSAARAGKNVVLVNADMRRPSLNDLFNTDEPNGLADVLIGTMTLDEALVSSDTDNLSILHSGTPDRNPSDMISQPQMGAIFEALRSETDLVIVDTPPCSVVADALLLAPYADCILQVVSIGSADQTTVLDTVAALRTAEPKVMVFFANRVPSERSYSNNYLYPKNGSAYSKNGKNGGSNGHGAARKALPQADQPEPADTPPDDKNQSND